MKNKQAMIKEIMNEEMKDIFMLLEEAGMNPQLCDKAVPYFDVTVQAGIPTDPGDITPAGMVWMPEDLVNSTMLMLKVRGESMRDAGFCPGDRIVVDYDTGIVDGDIVVATINGESTLKSYMTDENGDMWLVPHNPDFEAFRLTDEVTSFRMGKVVQHVKTNPRMGFNEIRKVMERTRNRLREQRPPAKEEVVEAIRCVAPHVTNSRMWFAVYRVLVDRKVLRENAFDTFVHWLEEDVPAHPYMPKAVDLQRLAVQSFSKPVKLWNADNAPVSGKRFRDYCDIARRMEEAL